MAKKKFEDLPKRREVVLDAHGKVPHGWKMKHMRSIVRCDDATCALFEVPFTVVIGLNADGVDRVKCGGCGDYIVNVWDVEEVDIEIPE